MNSERDKVGKGMAGGGTTGTGPAEPVSGVDRAAGEGQFGTDVLDDAELQEKEARRHGGAPESKGESNNESKRGDAGAGRPGLSGGEESVDRAAGESERTPAATGMRGSQSGRATGEGNARSADPSGAGEPGGMGGAGAAGTKHGRPPGGTSPAGNEGER